MKLDVEAKAPPRIFLKDYVAPAYSISSLHLHFKLNETRTLVTAQMTFKKKRDEPLILNGENLKLLSIRLNEKVLSPKDYQLTSDQLIMANTPAEFNLETEVEINPETNKSCQGLYLSSGIFSTQCEAEGFRHITYFLDRPDVMTSYTVVIEADKKKYPVLLSNGDLIEKKDLAQGLHQTTWKDPFKKPSYLFALVAGDLGVIEDSFTTRSGKKVKLEVYASHGKQDRCRYAMQSLKKAMLWDEERFGLEYDLNQFMIVSIDDFNMGAMENKGLNIFNSRLVLADPQSATDTDFERIESVVGHEYFHNWTGNRVTCRNWFELSLKEGLTVFRDQEFSSDLNSRAVQRIQDVDRLRISQFAEDAGPHAHPVRPESCLSVDNFYTPTIYEKGAEVIRMMQTLVGQKGFRAGMDEYFKRHDGSAVTILDFVNAIADANQVDLSQFKLWYSEPGTPQVEVHENYNPVEKTYQLTLKQSAKKPLFIPLKIGLLDGQGQNMISEQVLHLKQSEQTFRFDHISEKPVLSLNREFSAPIKLFWRPSQAELLHLIKYDSDAFNRREASYKMILQELRRLVHQARNQKELSADSAIIQALVFIVTDQKIDPRFKALMLQLPPEEILAQEEDILDAKAFFQAYKCIGTDLVKSCQTELIQLYQIHHARDTAADRALKNRILSLLNLGGFEGAAALAETQFTTAKNMTDQIGALAVLCQNISNKKEKALQDFFTKWKDDAVVFNKWLQVQAGSQQEGTFAKVKQLSQMPAFNFENPNNVFSLLGVFGANYLALQKDVESYAWLCEQILKIDRKNPQAAARLCGSFTFVKKMPEKIKQAAQVEIKKMLADPKLSKNSRELLESCI